MFCLKQKKIILKWITEKRRKMFFFWIKITKIRNENEHIILGIFSVHRNWTCCIIRFWNSVHIHSYMERIFRIIENNQLPRMRFNKKNCMKCKEKPGNNQNMMTPFTYSLNFFLFLSLSLSHTHISNDARFKLTIMFICYK